MFLFDNKKLVLYSICLSLFIDSIGIGLIFPILPALFIDQQYGLAVHDCYFSKGTLYGMSFAIFPLASIIGMPVLGYIADRYSKEIVILSGVFGFIITDILCIVAIVSGSVWVFLFSRLLMGFLSGTYAAGMAMISDISDNDNDRISNFKLYTLASLGGIFLSPGFVIFSDETNTINPFVMPFIIVMILSICSFAVLWFSFRKIRHCFLPQKHITTFRWQNSLKQTQWNYFSILLSVITNTSTRFLFISFLLIQFGLGLYNQSLSLFLVKTFKYTPKNMGILLIIISIVSISSMYNFQPLIKRFYGYQSQIKISLIIVIISFAIYAYYILTFDSSNSELYKGVSLFTIMILELLVPFITLGFTNLFANCAPKSEQGKIMGNYGQISSVATVISGVLAGKLVFISYFLLIILSIITLMLGYMALKKYLIEV